MYSLHGTWCSHHVGFPIRKSPGHRLLAPNRSLSQLATSFIAFLRQGIHTHALSSLTIKFTLNTESSITILINATALGRTALLRLSIVTIFHASISKNLQLCSCPSIFKCQRTSITSQSSAHTALRYPLMPARDLVGCGGPG